MAVRRCVAERSSPRGDRRGKLFFAFRAGGARPDAGFTKSAEKGSHCGLVGRRPAEPAMRKLWPPRAVAFMDFLRSGASPGLCPQGTRFGRFTCPGVLRRTEAAPAAVGAAGRGGCTGRTYVQCLPVKFFAGLQPRSTVAGSVPAEHTTCAASDSCRPGLRAAFLLAGSVPLGSKRRTALLLGQPKAA